MFLIGLLLGYISGTVTESLGHKYFGHPRKWQRALYRKYPSLFSPFLNPMYQHLIIHHGKTYQSHIFQQFESLDHKRMVDSWIQRKLNSKLANLIWLEHYNLTLKGLSGTLPFAIPFLIGPLIIGLIFGSSAFLGALILAFSPVWMSKYIHPLIHNPQSIPESHKLIRWIARGPLGLWALKNHYIHHKYPEYNFNLVPGGDYLTGHFKKLSPSEELDFAQKKETYLELAFGKCSAHGRSLTHGKVSTNACVSSDEDLDPAKQDSSTFSEHDTVEFNLDFVKKAYIARKNPSYEDRFQFQQTLFQLKNKRPDYDDIKWGALDFGYGPEDRKTIQFSEWSQKKEFVREAYALAPEGGVYYRGEKFHTGDVLLMNSENNSDGMFSTLTNSPIQFGHIALVVMLRSQGREFPAIIEMCKNGVVSMPLKAALSSRVSTYNEIYSPTEGITADQRRKIEDLAHEYLEHPYPFDFNQSINDKTSMTCSQLVFDIYKRTGLEGPTSRSYYDKKTLANLKYLGIPRALEQAYLMPEDYCRSENFYLKSVIDNHQFTKLLSRALSRNRFQENWTTSILNPSSYPFSFYLFRFVVKTIQSGGFLSAFFLKRLVGLPKELFPKGALNFLSLASIADASAVAMTLKIQRELSFQNIVFTYETWQDLENDPQVKALSQEALKNWSQFFRSPLHQRNEEMAEAY